MSLLVMSCVSLPRVVGDDLAPHLRSVYVYHYPLMIQLQEIIRSCCRIPRRGRWGKVFFDYLLNYSTAPMKFQPGRRSHTQ